MRRFANHFSSLSILNKTIFVLFLILTFGAISWQLQKNSKAKYNTVKVDRSDITETVDESGVIKISGQTDIYSPTNGIVEEVYVKNGDSVVASQNLFKVRSTATDQEKQAALANYLSAKATLDAAQSSKLALQADMFGKWDSFRNLATNDTFEDSDGKPKYENRSLPEFHISEKEWLASENRYKSQEQVIAQAQALSASAWALYQATQSTIVKSTTNGIVANLAILPNDSVKIPSSTLSALSGTSLKPVLTIADFGVMGVTLALGENDIVKVKPGNEADITIESINNKIVRGVVTRVDDIGYDVKGVTKYDVFVKISDVDMAIKSGMSADVVITTSKVKNALSVPNSSIKPYKGGKAVQIVNKEGKLEFLPVIIGKRGEKMTEIIEGLVEGQEIVSALTNEQTKRANPLGF